MAGTYLIDGGSKVDVPLSSLMLRSFESGAGQGGEGQYIGMNLFPSVPVAKQSDMYYVMDKDAWLRVPDTLRAPKTPAKVGEWKVSSDRYFCDNYAFRTDYALETVANADAAIRVREGSTMFVTETLMRAREIRIANQVSSISNVGSGVALTGTAKWSNSASDPISDVLSGTAFIRNSTGILPNVMIMDYDTAALLRIHPVLRDYVKYTAGPTPGNAALSDQQLANIFKIPRIMIGTGIYNAGKEGAAGSLQNIWGNVAILAHIAPAAGLMTATAGLSFQWRPEGFPAPMVVERYMHPDPSAKTEYVEAQYFQSEKIVARELIYTLTGTL